MNQYESFLQGSALQNFSGDLIGNKLEMLEPEAPTFVEDQDLVPGQTYFHEATGQDLIYGEDNEFYTPEAYTKQAPQISGKMTREQWQENHDNTSFWDSVGNMFGAMGQISKDLGNFVDPRETARDLEEIGFKEAGRVGFGVTKEAIQTGFGDIAHLLKRAIPNMNSAVLDLRGKDKEADDIRYESYVQSFDRMEKTQKDIEGILEGTEVSDEVRQNLIRRSQTLSLFLDPTTLVSLAAALPSGGSSLSAIGAKTAAKAALKSTLSKIPGGLSAAGKINHGRKVIQHGAFMESPTAYILERSGRKIQKTAGKLEEAGDAIKSFAEKAGLDAKSKKLGVGVGAIGGFATQGTLEGAVLGGLGVGGVQTLVAAKFFKKGVDAATDLASTGQKVASKSTGVHSLGKSIETLGMKVAARHDDAAMKSIQRLMGNPDPAGTFSKLSRFWGSPTAVRVWGGLSDNAARSALVDGFTGFLATGTVDGTMQEIGEGLVLGNAAYFGARGTKRVGDILQRNGFAPYGSLVNMEADGLVQQARRKNVDVFLQTLDDKGTQESLQSIRQQAPDIAYQIVEQIQNQASKNNINGRAYRLLLADNDRVKNLIVAQEFGISEAAIQRFKETGNAPEGISAEAIKATEKQINPKAIKGFKDVLTDNSQGDTVPSVVVNTDFFFLRDKSGKITGANPKALKGLLAHESFHGIQSAKFSVADGAGRGDQIRAAEAVNDFESSKQIFREALLSEIGVTDKNGDLDQDVVANLHDALVDQESESGIQREKWNNDWDPTRKEEALDTLSEELSAYLVEHANQTVWGTGAESALALSKKFSGNSRKSAKVRDKLNDLARKNAADVASAQLDDDKSALEAMGVLFDPLTGTPLDGNGKVLLPDFFRKAGNSNAGLSGPLMEALADYTVKLDKLMGMRGVSIGTSNKYTGKRQILEKADVLDPKFKERNPHIFSPTKVDNTGASMLKSEAEMKKNHKEEVSDPVIRGLEMYERTEQEFDPEFAELNDSANGFQLRPMQRVNKDGEGKWTGNYFTDAQLNVLETELSPFMFEKLAGMNQEIKDNFGQVVRMGYFGAIKRGSKAKYGSIPRAEKTVAIQGFNVTKDNNFVVQAIDIEQMHIDAMAEKKKGNKSELVRKLGKWKDPSLDSWENVNAAIEQVLVNRAQGEPGASNGISPQQRETIDQFLGFDTTETARGEEVVNFNPNKTKVRGQNERLWKSYRLDRIDPPLFQVNHPMRMPINYWANKARFSVEQSSKVEGIKFSIGKPWNENFPKNVQFTNGAKLASHPGRDLAKAGDEGQAWSVAKDLAKPEKLKPLAEQFPDAILVAPHGEEAAGINALPVALAKELGQELGLEVDSEIVLSNKPKRTGSDAIHRLKSRPEFAGIVQEGANYILVDDTVTQGGTFAELRNFIEKRGGQVVGTTTFAASQGSSQISLTKKTQDKLDEKFGEKEVNEVLKPFDLAVQSLTESEAKYLLSFKQLKTFVDKMEK